MASVSSLGLSGLPLTDLLDKLKTNESQILNTIKDRQTAASHPSRRPPRPSARPKPSARSR